MTVPIPTLPYLWGEQPE